MTGTTLSSLQQEFNKRNATSKGRRGQNATPSRDVKALKKEVSELTTLFLDLTEHLILLQDRMKVVEEGLEFLLTKRRE